MSAASDQRGGFFRFDKSRTDGLSAEARFEQWATTAEVEGGAGADAVLAATEDDNRIRHVDDVLRWKRDDGGWEQLTADVKMQKRARRGDKAADGTHTWVELHGAQDFNHGWAFGAADVIAFERPEGWLLVPTRRIASNFMKHFREKAPEFTRDRDDAIANPMAKVYCRRGLEALVYTPWSTLEDWALKVSPRKAAEAFRDLRARGVI